MARYWIGTSGWSYANWRGPFYPPGSKAHDWLAFYAQHLCSVEINTTFYRLPRAAMLAGWHAHTPASFLFAIKAWRVITHFRRLRECDAALASFLGAIAPLAEKAGPVLFQLPPHFARDAARLSDFLALLSWRRSPRHVSLPPISFTCGCTGARRAIAAPTRRRRWPIGRHG